MIRFEREFEERLARWIGGHDWQEPPALDRLFAEAEPVAAGHGAPPETVALWVKRVASMGPDEIDDFERRTFASWDRTSLGDLRIAIQQRRRGRSLTSSSRR